MGTYRPELKKRDHFTEYSVYIFHEAVPDNDNDVTYLNWERRFKTFSLRAAMRNAEKLFRSRAYDRVEIRKISFDAKAECRTDKILKIYKKTADRPVGMMGLFQKFFKSAA